MDFAFTPDEDAFRDQLRTFLADELPDWWRGMFVEDERIMPLTREICRKLADRGWLDHGLAGRARRTGRERVDADGRCAKRCGPTRNRAARST